MKQYGWPSFHASDGFAVDKPSSSNRIASPKGNSLLVKATTSLGGGIGST